MDNISVKFSFLKKNIICSLFLSDKFPSWKVVCVVVVSMDPNMIKAVLQVQNMDLDGEAK